MNSKSDLIRSRTGRFFLERLAKFYDQFICTAGAVRRQARKSRKIGTGLRFSVGIPHYNRGALIYRPLFHLLDHPAVEEVVIVDDGSREEEFLELKKFVDSLGCRERIKVFRREENRGALFTKLECVGRCSTDWVLVLDSDNTAFRRYLDILGGIANPNSQAFYCASWAWPFFSFEGLGREAINFERAEMLCRDGRLRKFYIINDGNYLVNRKAYTKIVSQIGEISSDVVDVMVVNYLWLSLGGKLEILPQSYYYHRVDASSFYKRTEDDSKRRLLEVFKRFEQGERCGEDFFLGLRSGRL